LERDDIFKPTIGNDGLHRINNDESVRIVNFATSKFWFLREPFSRTGIRGIHKYTWTSPAAKTHNQISHIWINRCHSRILDVRSFRGDDFDTDHYLIVAKVRERLTVSKQAAQNSDGERFNLGKVNKLEVTKQ